MLGKNDKRKKSNNILYFEDFLTIAGGYASKEEWSKTDNLLHRRYYLQAKNKKLLPKLFKKAKRKYTIRKTKHKKWW